MYYDVSIGLDDTLRRIDALEVQREHVGRVVGRALVSQGVTVVNAGLDLLQAGAEKLLTPRVGRAVKFAGKIALVGIATTTLGQLIIERGANSSWADNKSLSATEAEGTVASSTGQDGTLEVSVGVAGVDDALPVDPTPISADTAQTAVENDGIAIWGLPTDYEIPVITAEPEPATPTPPPTVVEVTPPAPAVVEAASPLPVTLLDTVRAGERKLVDIPGAKVGEITIDGICLSGVDVSVTNAVDPVRDPTVLDGFDWSLLNTDPNAPIIQPGDYEGARARLNPIYKLVRDDTPQQSCTFSAVSEYPARWEKPVTGSVGARTMATVAGELEPQANIHPDSVLPGQKGVTYIQGHRSTESAPFLNLDALVSGQIATLTDGNTANQYAFVGYEKVAPDMPVADILQKQVGDGNTLIISTCDDGSTVRLLAIFTQIA